MRTQTTLLTLFVIHCVGYVENDNKAPGYVPQFDPAMYTEAHRLLDHAWNYEYFACALNYMHRGTIGIGLDDTVLKPSHGFFERPEFEAYSLLSTNVARDDEVPMELPDDFAARVRVKGNKFRCVVSPSYVRELMARLRPIFLSRFELPSRTQFSQYTLEEFAETYLALFAICWINYHGRFMAIKKGCGDFSIADSIVIQTPEGLARRVARYSTLSKETCKLILQDLTYGGGGIKYPDPAIQPLIPLDDATLAIMPSVVLGSSAERNFCVLLNRLAKEREAYRLLADQKEALLRNRILEDLKHRRFRTWWGKVPGRKDLPDIDLAIIDDEHNSCLLCELKWFIGPSDPREWIEKAEEVAKGISQARSLQKAYREGAPGLTRCLGISPSYRFASLVATPGWMGQWTVHHDQVPVVGAAHLAIKLASSELSTTIGWLENRDYLPISGKDFRLLPRTFKIGKWRLEWYQIEPLTAQLFRPT